MKFTSVFTFALAVATVSATPFRETNGERLARGLPPLPPQRRSGTPAYAAKRTSPSSAPGQCSTGTLQCCQSTAQASDPIAEILLGLLGIVLPGNALVGLTCSPLNILGGGTCFTQTVCCTDNSSSLISIGCLPITL
ncbi:fungal hydrophobin-domain-containing protein [Rhodocollybia butyracea]|uniref:Hydrophobin n=1 Tax=Rhodocollybia butyracea TaxID=206335 RepID=A0A9P5QA90_9AGAR|nr:fungal hydrophobin-domain-containing protein [Rhodocollybia butyracea]